MKEMENSTPSLAENHPGYIQNSITTTGNTTGTITIQPGSSISFPKNQISVEEFIEFVLQKHKEEYGFEGEARDRYYFLKGFLSSKKEEMPNLQITNFGEPVPIPPNYLPGNGDTYPFLGKQVTC